jgi:hypothetical protein
MALRLPCQDAVLSGADAAMIRQILGTARI